MFPDISDCVLMNSLNTNQAAWVRGVGQGLTQTRSSINMVRIFCLLLSLHSSLFRKQQKWNWGCCLWDIFFQSRLFYRDALVLHLSANALVNLIVELWLTRLSLFLGNILLLFRLHCLQIAPVQCAYIFLSRPPFIKMFQHHWPQVISTNINQHSTDS